MKNRQHEHAHGMQATGAAHQSMEQQLGFDLDKRQRSVLAPQTANGIASTAGRHHGLATDLGTVSAVGL